MKRAADPKTERDGKTKRSSKPKEQVHAGLREPIGENKLKLPEEAAKAETDSAKDSSAAVGSMADEYDFKREFMTFPEKLMALLEDDSTVKECLWWLPDGKAFCFVSTERFRTDILEKHFEGTLFDSFTRKLNRWGFKRLSTKSIPEGSIAYHHKKFRKGRNDLLIQVRCNTGVGSHAELPSEGSKDSQNSGESDKKPSARSPIRPRSSSSFGNRSVATTATATQNLPLQSGELRPENPRAASSAAQSGSDLPVSNTLFTNWLWQDQSSITTDANRPQNQEPIINLGLGGVLQPSDTMQSAQESDDAARILPGLNQQRATAYLQVAEQVLQNLLSTLPRDSTNPVERNIAQQITIAKSFISTASSMLLGSDQQASNILPQTEMTTHSQEPPVLPPYVTNARSVGDRSLRSNSEMQALPNDALALHVLRQQQNLQQQQQQRQLQHILQQQYQQRETQNQQQINVPRQAQVSQAAGLQQQPLNLVSAIQLLSRLSSLSSSNQEAPSENTELRQLLNLLQRLGNIEQQRRR